jgi:hypothetical protein
MRSAIAARASHCGALAARRHSGEGRPRYMSTTNPTNDAIGVCPQCAQQFEIGARVGAKIGGAALGAYVGNRATEHWLGVLAGAVIGGVVGHVIDRTVLPTCPTCRVALEVLATVI